MSPPASRSSGSPPLSEHSVEQTRLRLLQAAREIYAGKGLRGTTTREIAERAGLNETTLFRHFGTKGALLDAMREHFCAVSELRATLERADAPLDEALREIGMQIFEHMRRDQDLIAMGLAEAVLNPESAAVSWRAPRQKRKLMIEFIERRIASGEICGDARAISGFFVGSIFSYVMSWRVLCEDVLEPERFIALLTAYLLNGVRAR